VAGNPFNKKQEIYLLTGNTGSGKSSFLAELVRDLRSLSIPAGGFLAPSFLDYDGSRSYQILDLTSDKSLPLASRKFREGWQREGNYSFNPEALHLGIRILMDPDIGPDDIIIVDEVGPFELEGRIWAVGLDHLRSEVSCTMIWTVRKPLLDSVIRNWQIHKPVIIDIEKHSTGQACEMIFRDNS
jgi:nucleoside-triphosphatase THEP1